jgi:hypothetical protein
VAHFGDSFSDGVGNFQGGGNGPARKELDFRPPDSASTSLANTSAMSVYNGIPAGQDVVIFQR